jgi:hypothetical protein
MGVSDATDCGARFHSLLDGFGLHVFPSHFGSHGFGQVAPNLGISIEHSRVNQSTVRKQAISSDAFLCPASMRQLGEVYSVG